MSKRKTRPAYMTCRVLMDPETGELVPALVASSDIDRAILRQKRVAKGREYRVIVEQARSAKFHRLVHALGQLVVENVDAFAGLDAHAAIKRLQREAGICCEEQEITIPGLGSLTVKVAESLAFDCMDEAAFRQLYQGICAHIAATYWPELPADAVDAMADLMPEVAA
ncbi:MAG: hypothetical protein ABFE08_01125 [Armatimonadia bacterium]